MTVIYSLSKFYSLKNKDYENILSQEVLNDISDFLSKLNITDTKKNIKQEKYKKKDTINWEQVRDFKPTKITETLNSFDKILNDLRISLNKISNKNLDLHKSQIEEKIDNVLNNLNTNENLNELSRIVFDISSTNQFFSILYATLYKDLIKKYVFLKDNLNTYINEYKESLKNIKYIEPDKNYNDYCNYNKINDKNKSITLFLINLAKLDILDFSTIEEIVVFLQNRILENNNEKNYVNENEEYIEVLYIIITSNIAKSFNKAWNESVISNVEGISNIKSNDNNGYLSISSRAKFRCKDIIEFLQK